MKNVYLKTSYVTYHGHHAMCYKKWTYKNTMQCLSLCEWAYLWDCLAELIKTPYNIFHEFVLAYFYKFSKIANENSL
jgi:hypothetical protein